MTPLGIEPMNFRIVVQCLNQLRYRMPLWRDVWLSKWWNLIFFRHNFISQKNGIHSCTTVKTSNLRSFVVLHASHCIAAFNNCLIIDVSECTWHYILCLTCTVVTQ